MKKTPYDGSSQINRQKIPFSIAAILPNTFIMEFKDREAIVNEGQELPFLFYVLAGKAKIIKNEPNGKRVILQFLQQNDWIGDLTIVQAEKATKEVIAIGDTICLGIPIADVEEYLMTNTAFLKYLSQYIGQKLLKRMDHFSASQTFELKYRLAELMVAVSVEGIYAENQLQISEYLGVSYRHLMHTLKFFREGGCIQKVDQGYELNIEKLQLFIQEGHNK